jgi:hypothetical protein
MTCLGQGADLFRARGWSLQDFEEGFDTDDPGWLGQGADLVRVTRWSLWDFEEGLDTD